jgi:hypothetical protein
VEQESVTHILPIRLLSGDSESVESARRLRLQINIQGEHTMTRDNTIVLSDEEKALVEETKQTLYGEESIPHGHVIGYALRQVVHDARTTGAATEVTAEN